MALNSEPRRHRTWAVLELGVSILVVLLDLLVPTLVVLVLLAVSLLLRRNGLRSLGFNRLPAPLSAAGEVLVLTAGWTLLQIGLVMPVLNGYSSVWASVLGHGFNNTIGLTTFFVVGPVYGLW